MHVPIQYCYANMRSMFIKIHNRRCNILQLGIIYHCRHNDNQKMQIQKHCIPVLMAFMFFLALSQ